MILTTLECTLRSELIGNDIIMPVFLPPDFCFHTFFFLNWDGDGSALTPFLGQHFKPLPKFQTGPLHSPSPPCVRQTPIGYF